MSSDSVNSYMPPCSSSAPGHDINMMWAWKSAAGTSGSIRKSVFPSVSRMSETADSARFFSTVRRQALCRSSDRPGAVEHPAPPRGHGNPEVRARDYGHGRAVPRG
jgi:hypothetical protein